MQFFGTRRTYKTFSTASNSSSKSFASRPVDDNEKTGQPSWYLSRVGFTSRPSESDPSWNNSSALSKIFPSTGDREASFDLWRRNRVCSTWTITFPSGHQNFLWRSNFFECVIGYSSVRARLRVLLLSSPMLSYSKHVYIIEEMAYEPVRFEEVEASFKAGCPLVTRSETQNLSIRYTFGRNGWLILILKLRSSFSQPSCILT